MEGLKKTIEISCRSPAAENWTDSLANTNCDIATFFKTLLLAIRITLDSIS
jgi:hypothetical protein